MRTVKEVSKLTGVSVRTLHYYDAIGLLEPTKVTDAGYRMYDDTSLSRLQNILLFRELQFPLKEIKEILDSPNFNQEEAIAQQIKLLELQYKHIGELISFAREIQTKGVKTMNFEVFDAKEIEQYKAEVKSKWGNSKAYQDLRRRCRASSGDYVLYCTGRKPQDFRACEVGSKTPDGTRRCVRQKYVGLRCRGRQNDYQRGRRKGCTPYLP